MIFWITKVKANEIMIFFSHAAYTVDNWPKCLDYVTSHQQTSWQPVMGFVLLPNLSFSPSSFDNSYFSSKNCPSNCHLGKPSSIHLGTTVESTLPHPYDEVGLPVKDLIFLQAQVPTAIISILYSSSIFFFAYFGQVINLVTYHNVRW